MNSIVKIYVVIAKEIGACVGSGMILYPGGNSFKSFVDLQKQKKDTLNSVEIKLITKALDRVKYSNKIEVITKNDYIFKAMTGTYPKNKFTELWKLLDGAISRHPSVTWTKASSGDRSPEMTEITTRAKKRAKRRRAINQAYRRKQESEKRKSRRTT